MVVGSGGETAVAATAMSKIESVVTDTRTATPGRVGDTERSGTIIQHWRISVNDAATTLFFPKDPAHDQHDGR